ncbi:hypothetical protein AUEXF2481DRAFT_640626 [Aureobasidium subglaciale EXF-2481]|uniref:Uncharacterized protein n=1 Tax=Aureobasidium subglaciale (strain EXF-2481) TaxID=1043005 RepID=A0A074YF96_AURSE|nr:uncharacterized protein AUEXF2481DRAFT_640626 [Aureobasidium subglaciale EXF-2481]KEQ96488.1 hypothetical protein AUEXF2481DRAFT_640626 [Aureobasidium subglaciale EXF-2481]
MYEIDLSYISRAEILPPFFTFYMELPPGTRLYTWDVDHASTSISSPPPKDFRSCIAQCTEVPKQSQRFQMYTITASSSVNGKRWLIWQHPRCLADWKLTCRHIYRCIRPFGRAIMTRNMRFSKDFCRTHRRSYLSSGDRSPPKCISTVKEALAKPVTSDSVSSPRFTTAPTNGFVC